MIPAIPRRLVLAIAGLGLVLRLLLALKPIAFIDRLFVPDDAYYTCSVARSLAAGTGPVADGLHATNGFQPLLAFLLAPVAAAFPSRPDALLRAAVLLLSLADVLTCLLLARLAGRAAGPIAGVAAALVWAVSPVAVANALGGLEASLAVMLSVALVVAWPREGDGGARAAAAGVLAGLALLARVDAAFLVGALGLLTLARGRWRGFVNVAAAAFAAGLVVLPWWAWEWRHLGTLVPESGPAVRFQARLLGATPWTGVAPAAATLLGPPLVESRRLAGAVAWEPAAGLPAALLLVVAGIAAFEWLRRRGLLDLPAHALLLHAGAIVVFYTAYVPAHWFFRRYFEPVYAAGALVLAILVAEVAPRVTGSVRDLRLSAALSAAIVALALAPTLAAVAARPERARDDVVDTPKGYRDVAGDLLPLLPRGAVLASLQSGALSYFAHAGSEPGRVVNLDGVVDGEAARAAREGLGGEYLRKRGATHFAGTERDVRLLARIAPGLPLAVLGSARAQGGHVMTLYRIGSAR